MDPTLRTKIVASLKEAMPTLSPRMRTTAKYIIDNQSDFGLDPIRDTARKAAVSTYTLVNVAKRMGFSGFEAFRQPFRHALIASPAALDSPAWIADLRQESDLGTIFAKAAENAVSIVTRSLERQHLDELTGSVELLLSAKKVYLTAMRSSYAIAYYLHYVGRMALPSLELIPRHKNSAIDDLNDAEPGDVLIAISVTPYSRETIKACEWAQKKGVKLIIISDSEIVAPGLAPEYTLVASVLSTHSFACFSGMMAMVELLVALLMHLGGQEARERIKSYEHIRNETDAYWVAQKKH